MLRACLVEFARTGLREKTARKDRFAPGKEEQGTRHEVNQSQPGSQELPTTDGILRGQRDLPDKLNWTLHVQMPVVTKVAVAVFLGELKLHQSARSEREPGP